jgi:hypothetical protein
MRDYTPSAASVREFLTISWEEGDLRYLLGRKPRDLKNWEIQQTGDSYSFAPPDGPGFSLPRHLLIAAIMRAFQKALTEQPVFQPPRRFVKSMLPKELHGRLADLVDEPLWREAEEYNCLFLYRMLPEACMDEAVAKEINDLNLEYQRLRGRFLEMAETTVGNFHEVWFCEQIQAFLQSGRSVWGRKVDRPRYKKAAKLLMLPDSQYSPELKLMLRQETDELDRRVDERSVLEESLEDRQKHLEEKYGGRIFRKTLGREGKRGSNRPFVTIEIVRIVSYLRDLGASGRKAYSLTARTLVLLDREWYEDPNPDLVRHRYTGARKKGIRAPQPRTQPLVHKDAKITVRVVED